MRKKRNPLGILLLAIGVLAVLAGAVLVMNTPDRTQYVLVPETTDAQKLTQSMNSLDEALDGFVWSAALRCQNASVSSAENSASVTVYAVWKGYFDAVHETLRSGRLITEGDIENSSPGIVLTSSLASAVFPGEDPVGRKLTVGNIEMEVVGVAADSGAIGENTESIAFIPMTACQAAGLVPQTLQAEVCASGSGNSVLAANALKSWNAGGTAVRLDREKLGAVMPLRWIAVLAAVLILCTAAKEIVKRAQTAVSGVREDLKRKYAEQEMPKILGTAAMILAVCAAWLGCALLAARFAAEPLYTFTDWVPQNPVEISSIKTTVQNLLFSASGSAALRTAGSVSVSLAKELIHWGLMTSFGGLLLLLHGRRAGKRRAQEKSAEI